jgi:hypothetical protein
VDRSIEHIGEVNKLTMALRPNPISDKVIAEFQQALPNCRITR